MSRKESSSTRSSSRSLPPEYMNTNIPSHPTNHSTALAHAISSLRSRSASATTQPSTHAASLSSVRYTLDEYGHNLLLTETQSGAEFDPPPEIAVLLEDAMPAPTAYLTREYGELLVAKFTAEVKIHQFLAKKLAKEGEGNAILEDERFSRPSGELSINPNSPNGVGSICDVKETDEISQKN